MAKEKHVFFCKECGYESPKWVGQCPSCKSWSTMTEEVIKPDVTGRNRSVFSGDDLKTYTISEVSLTEDERTEVGMEEFDRVLGGGIVPGSLILVGGDPGIGKSTLLLQTCRLLGDKGKNVLYVSGEESLKQIKMRALRIGEFKDTVSLYTETNLNKIEQVIGRVKPDVVVIDSIQTMYMEEVGAAPGSVSQVRESCGILLRIAKGMGISVFIVGHVTKEGTVAGPRVLEHMVDTVLYFEGDRHASYRILRGVKNRFGSTNEIGVFEMRQSGLSEVPNPSEFMLEGRPKDASGCVVTCCVEGTRPLLAEVQALVAPTSFGIPRRQSQGLDNNRVNLLMAVLEKKVGFSLGNYDAYVNIAGGMKITEPAIDLGVIVAICSSYKNKNVDEGLVVLGEVGLSGEVRSISQIELRVSEAKKLGFKTVIVPYGAKESLSEIKGIEVILVENVNQALEKIF